MDDSWNDGLFSSNNVADLDSWGSNSFNANSANTRSHASSYSSPVSSSNWGYTPNHSNYCIRPSLNIPSHIKIEKLPFDASLEKIRNIFGRYGKISRVVCDYRINEEKLYCWLDYEDKRVIENAIGRENNRKVDNVNLTVIKGNDSVDSGSYNSARKSGSNKDSWSNDSWPSEVDNSSGFNTSRSNIEHNLEWKSGHLASWRDNSWVADKRSNRARVRDNSGSYKHERRSDANDKGENRRPSRGKDRFSPYVKTDTVDWSNPSDAGRSKHYDDLASSSLTLKSDSTNESSGQDLCWD